MKIAVIDDLSDCRNEIRRNINRYFDRHYVGTLLSIDEYSSGQDFLNIFVPEQYDLIFIDYYMDQKDGMSVARDIREKDSFVPLIFITSSPDYAIDSYQVRASGYLLKPFSYDEFERSLSQAKIEKVLGGMFLKISEEKILLREIIFCDRDKHYVQIHTASLEIQKYRMPFEELQKLLSPYPWFVSCYRGCIVNLKRVKGLQETSFLMDTGLILPFRVKDCAAIKKQYAQFLFNQAREVI